MTPPVAKKTRKKLTKHGHIRIDNYYWLNDRDNPEVINYLNKENDYTNAMMEDTKDFQERLYAEIIGRIKQTDMSVPYKDNGFFYYTRFDEGQEYPLYCRKKESLEAREEILLNASELAKEYDYFQVGGLSVSPDNKLLAFSTDTVSRRLYTIRIKTWKRVNIFPMKFSIQQAPVHGLLITVRCFIR